MLLLKALLFGDWGTSRLYVLGLAFLVAGRTSFWLILAMSLLILAVGWAYSQICRLYPDGGGVYTAARQRSRLLPPSAEIASFDWDSVKPQNNTYVRFDYVDRSGNPLPPRPGKASAVPVRPMRAARCRRTRRRGSRPRSGSSSS